MFLFHCFVHKWPRNVDKVELETGSVTPWWFYEKCQKGLDICLHFRNTKNQHSQNLYGLPCKSNTMAFILFWIISFVNLKIWNSATTFLTTFSAKFRRVHTLLHVSIYYLILLHYSKESWGSRVQSALHTSPLLILQYCSSVFPISDCLLYNFCDLVVCNSIIVRT